MMVDVKMKTIKLEPADITITALEAAVVMKNRVFREEGLPVKVISDKGPQFMSGFMKELYRLLGIEGNLSTAYHPQTDGQTKRVNQEVKKFLRMFTNSQQDDWVDWLPLAEFMHNNAVHEATGNTPFFLNRGRHPCSLLDDQVMEKGTTAGAFLETL
jgi:transposase InsO family protein